MAKIVAFATQKGGSGKSTLCAITAAAVHNRTKKRILVVDADKQGTLRDLRELEGNPENAYPVQFFNWEQRSSHQRFGEIIDQVDEQYDLVLIDSPGRIDDKETRLIVLASDVIAVPLVASPFDVKSTKQFLSEISPLVREHGKKVVGIINKRDRTVEHAILSELEGYEGMELMTSYISNLARYKRSISTVEEIVTGDDPTDEYNQYIKEFLKMIK